MSKYRIVIISAVFLAFLIGGNVAWLNPRAGFLPGFRISDRVPFLWQYNTDTKEFINSAMYFPGAFATGENVRITRPLYPALAKILGWPVTALLQSSGRADSDNALRAGAAAGYIITKLLIYMIFGLVCFRLLSFYLAPGVSLLATLLILLHSYSIESIATYHTNEIQFISPCLLTYFLLDASKEYSHKKNIVYSIIAGLLALIKPVASIYLTILLIMMVSKQIRKAILSVVACALPIVLWYGFVYVMGWFAPGKAGAFSTGEISFYLEVFNERQPFHDFWGFLNNIQLNWMQFILACAYFYSVWLVLAPVAIPYLKAEGKVKRIEVFFIAFLVLTCWLQAYLTGQMQYPRMVSDFSFVVFGLGAFVIVKFLRPYLRREKLLVGFVTVCWCVWGMLQIVEMPWVSPYDQIKTPAVSGQLTDYEMRLIQYLRQERNVIIFFQ